MKILFKFLLGFMIASAVAQFVNHEMLGVINKSAEVTKTFE